MQDPVWLRNLACLADIFSRINGVKFVSSRLERVSFQLAKLSLNFRNEAEGLGGNICTVTTLSVSTHLLNFAMENEIRLDDNFKVKVN
jgi:hypothetical protein